jgi:4-amino-4-deoxy-L-arabinose transferase-like glycosyltransferase
MPANRPAAPVRDPIWARFGSLWSKPAREAALFALLALSLRWACFAPLAQQPFWPAWDEAGYLAQAVGFAQLLEAKAAGTVPSQETVELAYGRGIWPPLGPLLGGLLLWLCDPAISWARWVSLLASAATTALVFLLTVRWLDRKSARAAALVHALYPAFVGFSHLLWSESLFIAFLLGTALALARLVEAETAGATLRRAAACGAVLGLAALTRAAALPLLLAVPILAVLLVHRRRRLAAAALVLASALLVSAPWLGTLYAREGRWVPFSTSSGYNLLLGQTPLPTDGDEDRRAQKVDLNRAIRERMAATATSRDEAARALAVERALADPRAFVARTAARAAAMLRADSHLMRHRLQAVYPPGSQVGTVALFLALELGFVLLLAAIALGLASPGWPAGVRASLLLLAGAVLLPPLLTVATPRMALPALALLLPAAGRGGLAIFVEKRWRPALLALGAAGTLQAALGWQVGPASSYYAPARELLRTWLPGNELRDPNQRPVRDRFAFVSQATPCRELLLRTADPRLRFEPDATELRWQPSDGTVWLVETASLDPAAAATLELSCADGGPGPRQRLDLLRPASWHRWTPTGLPGLEAMWLGGGGVNPTPVEPRWPVPVPLQETAGFPEAAGSSATRTPASLPEE